MTCGFGRNELAPAFSGAAAAAAVAGETGGFAAAGTGAGAAGAAAGEADGRLPLNGGIAWMYMPTRPFAGSCFFCVASAPEPGLESVRAASGGAAARAASAGMYARGWGAAVS